MAAVSTQSDAVTLHTDGPVTTITIDDGKANAFTHAIIDDVRTGLRHAADNGGAVVLAGRPGRFSGGFDLAVMTSGPDAAMPLLAAGAEMAFDIFMSPVPVVVACTGHAVAMGAIVLMAADTRIGSAGGFKIGMNEVAIGMPVPRFAMGLARDRLDTRHFVAAIAHAQLYNPTDATGAGYLDEVVDPDVVVDRAVGHATHLADTLSPGAFRMTRDIMRSGVAAELRAGLEADLHGGGFG